MCPIELLGGKVRTEFFREIVKKLPDKENLQNKIGIGSLKLVIKY
jgi:hypothetical protein